VPRRSLHSRGRLGRAQYWMAQWTRRTPVAAPLHVQASRRRPPQAEGQAGKPPKVPKKESKDPVPKSDALNRGKKTKQKYGTVVASVRAVLANIGQTKEWEWANNEAMQLPLKGALQTLESTVAENIFYSEAMAQDLAVTRRQAQDKTAFDTDVGRFADNIEPLIDQLETKVRIILAQHRASMLG